MIEFGLVHLYLGFLIFGVGYAVIVNLLGAFGADHHGTGGFDGHDGIGVSGDVGGHDFAGHGDAGSVGSHDGNQSAGLSPFSPLMLATFSTLFGGVGFISLGVLRMIPLIPISVVNIVSFLVSAALSVILTSYFSFFLVKLFLKTQTSSNISTSRLIGREAEATLDLDPDKIGEITYLHGGSRQTNMARLISGAKPVKKGETVEIVSISENVMHVKPVEFNEPIQ